MGLFRVILLYIQRFIAFILFITFLSSLGEGDIVLPIFILVLIILVDFYDFKLIKNKIFSNNKTNSEVLIDKSVDISDEDTNHDDVGYYGDNYNILKCENGEALDTQRDNDYFNKLESEKEKIYDNYGNLSVEFEEIKQFGDLSKMVDFETKVHGYFCDDVLPKMLSLGLIETIEPITEKTAYDDRNERIYDYIGKLIDKKKFEEFKNILDNRLQYYKEGANEYLYDLYAKSLRRVGNYYKQNKLWEEAGNIFNIIEDMGQAGIMDKKSIIKIRKELTK